MSVDAQEYEDDPIIAALGISQDARPVIPPLDEVYGHYQETPPTFRLYHETLTMYMEGPLGRLAHKGKGTRCRSKLYVRADGNYDADITIGYTSLFGEGPAPTESTHRALYADYTRAKTTPWHE